MTKSLDREIATRFKKPSKPMSPDQGEKWALEQAKRRKGGIKVNGETLDFSGGSVVENG